MTKPLLENNVWEKVINLSGALKEAVMNPNTEFMTKLLFDARFLQKKLGKEITYWSNAIVKLKLELNEKKALTLKELVKNLPMPESEAKELLAYLKNMSEVLEERGEYSLNYASIYSRVFRNPK